MTQFETIAWYVLVALNIIGVIVFLLIGAKLINEAFFKKEEQ
jgi:putative Mn2+ efflux pump MntP